jgi:hypothetical protein
MASVGSLRCTRSGPSGKVKRWPPVHQRVYAVAALTLAPIPLAQPLGDTVGSSPSSTDRARVAALAGMKRLRQVGEPTLPGKGA